MMIPRLSAALLSALLCLPFLPAGASEPAPRTLSVSGSATVKALPDEAVVAFSIETRRSLPASKRRDVVEGTAEALPVCAALLAEAQAAGEQAVQRVRGALKALGVDERAVETQRFEVHPETWTDDGVRYFRGYLCRHVMSARLKDLSKADACV